ncbi:hypothetical protein [Thiolapillus sp.]
MSTDAKLTPEQIIEAYGERWSIESMFSQQTTGFKPPAQAGS